MLSNDRLLALRDLHGQRPIQTCYSYQSLTPRSNRPWYYWYVN